MDGIDMRLKSFEPGRVRIAYLFRGVADGGYAVRTLRLRLITADAGNDGTRCVPYGGTWQITGGAMCRAGHSFSPW